MESCADSNGPKSSIRQNYGGGCATRNGMEKGMETKQRRAGCTQTGNQLPFVIAIVASNPGDSGQGRVRCSNTGASRSDLVGKNSLRLYASSASGMQYCRAERKCQYPKVASNGPFFIR